MIRVWRSLLTSERLPEQIGCPELPGSPLVRLYGVYCGNPNWLYCSAVTLTDFMESIAVTLTDFMESIAVNLSDFMESIYCGNPNWLYGVYCSNPNWLYGVYSGNPNWLCKPYLRGTVIAVGRSQGVLTSCFPVLLIQLIRKRKNSLKGIVSRDFEWLQIILMDRAWVPDVPLKDNFLFFYVFILFLKC